jgi:hypothetical protein
MKVNDILIWKCPNFPANIHRWRVVGIHLGGLGKNGNLDSEGLIEMESLTHVPGWTGEWETHPRVFVPEVLTRALLREPNA